MSAGRGSYAGVNLTHLATPYTYCHITFCGESSMSIGTVFVNNRTQAVRLPLDVRLPEGVHKV
jgi:hypothetical protein